MANEIEYERIADALSRHRLRCYTRDGMSFEKAVGLYEEQLLWSAKLMISFHILEVSLRNKINDILAEAYGRKWFMPDQNIVSGYQAKQVREALEELKKNHIEVNSNYVIRALSFGFWTGLFSGKYEYRVSLWRNYLHQVFQERLTLRDVNSRLYAIRKTRNRVAHHERIRRPQQELDRCLEAIGWICPHTRDWTQDLVNRVCFSTAP